MKKLKMIFVVLLIIPCILLFTACKGNNDNDDNSAVMYTVTFPSGTGYSVGGSLTLLNDDMDAPAGEKWYCATDYNTVWHGEDYTFNFNLYNAYSSSDVIIKANDIEVPIVGFDGNLRTYKISNVTADQVLTVEGVEPNDDALEITFSEGNGYKAYVVGRDIRINKPNQSSSSGLWNYYIELPQIKHISPGCDFMFEVMVDADKYVSSSGVIVNGVRPEWPQYNDRQPIELWSYETNFNFTGKTAFRYRINNPTENQSILITI